MKIVKPLRTLALAAIAGAVLTACGGDEKDQNTVRIGTMAGPETEVMEVAKKVAKEQYDLNVEIVEFNDYVSPNAALDEGSLDANAYQHKPYLDEMMKSRDYSFEVAGKTFVYPMSVFSLNYDDLQALPENGKIAIPNDPSNEGRALIMLNDAGVITLKDRNNLAATPNDIAENPKNISFAELDAAQLPRSLQDVDFAVVNNTFATPDQLPEGAKRVLTESSESPYVNLIVVREGDSQRPEIQNFVKAYQTPEVIKAAQERFSDVVPGWK